MIDRCVLIGDGARVQGRARFGSLFWLRLVQPEIRSCCKVLGGAQLTELRLGRDREQRRDERALRAHGIAGIVAWT